MRCSSFAGNRAHRPVIASSRVFSEMPLLNWLILTALKSNAKISLFWVILRGVMIRRFFVLCGRDTYTM